MAIDFQAKQAEFSAYIRDPNSHPLPEGVLPHRMQMYRELFLNNINGFLCSNFPVLRKILSDERWDHLVQDFYARHKCETPHFSEIAEEFLAYLQNERQCTEDYPFLLELAHYEWVEMALSIAVAEPKFGAQNFSNNILDEVISLSPVAWPLVYQFPVERIGPDYLPQTPPDQASYLIVYRDRQDTVHFMQTTPFTYRLLQLIEQKNVCLGHDCLSELLNEMPKTLEAKALLQFGLQTMQELAQKGIIVPAQPV